MAPCMPLSSCACRGVPVSSTACRSGLERAAAETTATSRHKHQHLAAAAKRRKPRTGRFLAYRHSAHGCAALRAEEKSSAHGRDGDATLRLFTRSAAAAAALRLKSAAVMKNMAGDKHQALSRRSSPELIPLGVRAQSRRRYRYAAGNGAIKKRQAFSGETSARQAWWRRSM